MAGEPGADPPHLLVTARTEWSASLGGRFLWRWFERRRQRRLPGGLLGRCEHGVLAPQSPHPVGPDFGRRMQPTEGSHAGEAARQNVL